MRILPAAALLVSLVAPPGSAVAQAPAQGEARTQNTSPLSMQEQSLTEMLGMVQRNAVLAGAGAVCHAPVYDDIRACTIAFTRSWGQITGIPIPIDDVGQRVIEQTWSRAAGAARERQLSSSPPMTCPALLDEIRRATFWESCERLRTALTRQSPPAATPPAATPFPQTQGRPPQPPRSPGGFQIQ